MPEAVCEDCHDGETGSLEECAEWAEEHERDEPGHTVEIDR